MANTHARLDEPDEALVHATRALDISGRLGDLKLRILATTYLAQAHFYRDEYERVVELTTANVAALPPGWVHEFFGSTRPISVNDRFRLLASLAHLGRFAEAAEQEAEVIRLAEPTQHAYTVASACHAASMLHLVKGDWTKALSLIERQITELRRARIVGDLPMALAYSARALAYLGDHTEALTRVRECEQLLESPTARERGGSGSTYFSLGHACLLLGRLDEAQLFGDRAMRSISGRIDYVPTILHLLGDIATHPDGFDAERGAKYYREALALAESRRMRPLIAHCHHGLGTLARRTGNPEQAREHLATAMAMYREMGMAVWVDGAGEETAPEKACKPGPVARA